MTTNIQALATQARDIADKLGIRKFDISGSSVDENSVRVDRGEPKQVKASNRSSITVRVWNEAQTVGIASTTDTDPTGLELSLKTAAEASAFGVKDHAPDFSPEATVQLPDYDNTYLPQAPVAKSIETLAEAERELLEAHEAIAGVPYNGLSQRDIERFYLNSDGAERYEAGSYASVYLYSKTEQKGKKPRSAGAFRVDLGLDKLDVSGCVKEAADKTISHLNYKQIETGKYTVVFSAEAFLSLFGAFSNIFNAQSILDNRSLSTPDSLGTVIASPLLSVDDNELDPNNVSPSHFDGEGTPTRRLPLIARGVLSNFMHSAGTAKRMHAKPTGHANLGAKVTVSGNFTCVYPGEPAATEYSIETADNVIWIDEIKALHAGVSALEGSFSLPFDGWIVEQGQPVSIESATVAGDFRELLKSIVYVEKEAEVTPGGVCPRIWVEGLSITGD
ncbi:TldD/PmbA family protein [Synechococcus sp. PCC 7336]|uniref:TldD/PmbA family protein n=1 Tax=Synechococcus sp. PCC 7336 TaxID=195250 RepID=UPI00034B223D|nr:TldD/PmbA family protein [Synechococcus sp. PCC 7336]